MKDAVVILVTCSTAEEADRIAGRLVEERLAACVNIAGRVRSLFHWKGTLERETEFLLVIKTRRERFDAISARVRELHSYETPEIIGVPILLGCEDYLDWIFDSTAGTREGD